VVPISINAKAQGLVTVAALQATVGQRLLTVPQDVKVHLVRAPQLTFLLMALVEEQTSTSAWALNLEIAAVLAATVERPRTIAEQVSFFVYGSRRRHMLTVWL
jgi:hypothetical protein